MRQHDQKSATEQRHVGAVQGALARERQRQKGFIAKEGLPPRPVRGQQARGRRGVVPRVSQEAPRVRFGLDQSGGLFQGLDVRCLGVGGKSFQAGLHFG